MPRLSATSGSKFCRLLEFCYNNSKSIRTWTCSPLWVPDGWPAAQMENSASIYSSDSLRNPWESHLNIPLHCSSSNNIGRWDKGFNHSPFLCLSTVCLCDSLFFPQFLIWFKFSFWLKIAQNFNIFCHALLVAADARQNQICCSAENR